MIGYRSYVHVQGVYSSITKVTATDMQVKVAPADITSVEPTIWTYLWLHRQGQQEAGASICPKLFRSENCAFRFGMLVAAAALLSATITTRPLSVEIVPWLALACGLIEIGGFLVGVLLIAELQHAKSCLFGYWTERVVSLKRSPKTKQEERLRFVNSLRQT